MYAVIVLRHEAEKIVTANISVLVVRDQPDLDAHLREPADRLQRTSQMCTNADNDQTTLGTKAEAWPGNSQASRQRLLDGNGTITGVAVRAVPGRDRR
jgi:hypothetical protein